MPKNVHWLNAEKLKKSANEASIPNLRRFKKAGVKNQWKTAEKGKKRKKFMNDVFTFYTHESVPKK